MKGTLRALIALVVCCVGSLLMTGCLRKSKLKSEPVTYYYEKEMDGVGVEVEMMSASEIVDNFGVNFLASGIVPITLTIDNQTPDVLLLRGQSIHVPFEEPYKVAEKAHYNTILNTTCASYLSCLFFWPALLPSLGAGFYMAHANKVLTDTVCAQGLAPEDSLDILPYEQVSRVLFVPADDFVARFRMHVFNVHAKTFIPFNVALKATAPWKEGQETILAELAQA